MMCLILYLAVEKIIPNVKWHANQHVWYSLPWKISLRNSMNIDFARCWRLPSDESISSTFAGKFWRFSILVTPTGWSGWLWDLLLSWPLSASFTGQQQSTCLTDWFSSDSKSFIPHAIALYSLHICLARHHLMLTVYFKTVLSKHLTVLHLPTVCPLVFAMLLYYSQ